MKKLRSKNQSPRGELGKEEGKACSTDVYTMSDTLEGFMNWNGDCFILNKLFYFYANVNYALNYVFHFLYGVEYVQIEGESETSFENRLYARFVLELLGLLLAPDQRKP